MHLRHKPYRTYTLLDETNAIAQFWSNLPNAEYNEKTRALTLTENTKWLGGSAASSGLLYIRVHYECLWAKICWGMLFSDGVKEPYALNDGDEEDLSSFMNRSRGTGFNGYVVNGTPGGFCVQILYI